MTLAEIQPFVRYARRNEKLFREMNYVASDHRLFFMVDGCATVYLDELPIQLKKGDVIFWRAGIRYRVERGEGTVMAGFNFDLTQRNREIFAPIPPSSEKDFSGTVLENFSFSDAPVFDRYFVLKGAFALGASIFGAIEEFENKHLFYSERCSALLKDTLTLCCRILSAEASERSTVAVQKIMAYIKEHYGEKIDNKTIGALFGYHPNYISSIVKRHTGKPLHQYLLEQRVYVAIHLLQGTGLSVGEIAEKVGMGDVYQFSKTFKAVTGRTPKSFR